MNNSILLLTLSLLMNAAAFKYMGTNQAGAEFGTKLPGTNMVDYTFPKTSSIDYFVSSGMNIMRVPFLWERLQPQLNGTFDATYFGYLDKTVQYVTVTKGIYILLDVHNYLLYKDVQIGKGVDYSSFYNFWYQLANIYKSNPKVIFGLMNEPHDAPYANVYQAMQVGINGIRACGATNAITVPGNDWTGAHSWMDSAPYMSGITDPLNNFMYEMHQYFDDNYSGNGACVSTFDPQAKFGPATNWLRAAGKTSFLGEFGIENTPQCLNVLTKTMDYLSANSDVWVGWTWWAAGPWWGSAYKFSLEKGVGDAQLAVLKKYMTTSSPVPTPTPTPAQTTGSVIPSTTGSVKPSTTGMTKPSTTGSAPAIPATTGRVKTNTPSTTGANGGSAVPPGSKVNCTSGEMKCLSTGTFSTCSWGVWGSAQICPTSTYCSPSGKYIYCLKGSAPPTDNTENTSPTSSTSVDGGNPVPSTSTSSTSSNAAPVPSADDSCTLGQLRCSSNTEYQTCGHATSGFKWSASQSCQAGLSCHSFGQQVYCY